jgi:hypothetical protein
MYVGCQLGLRTLRPSLPNCVIFKASFPQGEVNCWAGSESTETHLGKLRPGKGLLPGGTESSVPTSSESCDFHHHLLPTGRWIVGQSLKALSPAGRMSVNLNFSVDSTEIGVLFALPPQYLGDTPGLGFCCCWAHKLEGLWRNCELAGPQAIKFPVTNNSFQYTKKGHFSSESSPEVGNWCLYRRLQLIFLDMRSVGVYTQFS